MYIILCMYDGSYLAIMMRTTFSKTSNLFLFQYIKEKYEESLVP